MKVVAFRAFNVDGEMVSAEQLLLGTPVVEGHFDVAHEKVPANWSFYKVKPTYVMVGEHRLSLGAINMMRNIGTSVAGHENAHNQKALLYAAKSYVRNRT